MIMPQNNIHVNNMREHTGLKVTHVLVCVTVNGSSDPASHGSIGHRVWFWFCETAACIILTLLTTTNQSVQ